MPELNKKFELVAGVSALSENEFIIDTKKKAQKEIDFPLLVPGIAPTGLATKTLIESMEDDIDMRSQVIQQAKTLTKSIREKRKEITKTVTDKWPPLIVAAIGEDVEKATQLGYKVKWVDGGHSPDEPSIKNSKPVIIEVEKHNHLEDKIRVINSKSETIALPWDVDHTNLYEKIGPTEPKSIKECRYLGVMKKGEFLNHHDPEDIDKDVYYIAEYVPKNEADESELSGAVKSKII
jgi:hypothetical protein